MEYYDNTELRNKIITLRSAHKNDDKFVMNLFNNDVYEELSKLTWREWHDDSISGMQEVYKLWFMIGLIKQAFCDEDLDQYFFKKFSSMSVDELFSTAFKKYKQNMIDSATEVTVEEE